MWVMGAETAINTAQRDDWLGMYEAVQVEWSKTWGEGTCLYLNN